MGSYVDVKGLSNEDAIVKVATHYGIPPKVLDGIWERETRRSTIKTMVSPKGAEGHFQTMPTTTRNVSKYLGRKLNPYDFSDSVNMAGFVLKENLNKFKNLPDAIRAYNGGWDPKRWGNKETTEYVAAVLGTAGMSGSPTQSTNVSVSARQSTRVPVSSAPMSDEMIFGGSYRAYTPNSAPLSDNIIWNVAGREFNQMRLDSMLYGGLRNNENLTAFEKAAIQDERIGGVLNSASNTQIDAALARVKGNLPKEVEGAAERRTIPEVNFDPTMNYGLDDIYYQGKKDQHEIMQSWSFVDQSLAAFGQYSATQAIANMVNTQQDYPKDPNYTYFSDDWFEKEKGYSQEEREFLRTAQSEEHFKHLEERINQRRYNTEVLGSQGLARELLASLAGGGALDAAGWAAGLGVMKGAQMARIGSTVLLSQGRIGASLFASSGEAALGNVLVDFTRDVSGEYVSMNDYIMSAGFGMGMGAVGGGAQIWKRGNPELKDIGDAMMNKAAQQEQELVYKAMLNVGEDATPAQLRAEAQRIQVQEISDTITANLADAPETAKMFPDNILEIALAEVKDADQLFATKEPNIILRTLRDRKDFAVQEGLDNIADASERRIISELYAKARQWQAANPIDPDRVKAWELTKLNALESTGLTLIKSKNPVLNMLAGTLLESTTGAVGRRRTAALTKHLRERIYMDDIVPETRSLYAGWRNEQGRTVVNDLYSGEYWAKFNRLVAEEIESRGLDMPTQPHPAVGKVADMLEAGYNRMRIDQQVVRTIGSRVLPTSSVGYMPHRISANKVRSLTEGERKAFAEIMSKQFQEIENFDKPFSDNLSKVYIERALTRANGGTDTPVNIHTTETADLVRDALKSMGLPDEEVTKRLAAFSRGGASHTKQRLKLNLMTEYLDVDGKPFRLMDLFETDQMVLYRSQARRVSGEVALAQYGVPGEQGLKLLRNAITRGKNAATDKELRAFDQVAAEFLGRPFGTRYGAVDNMTLVTSLAKLGGMAITQTGEFINGIGHLGVQHTMRAMGRSPELLKEVRALSKGELSGNKILQSIELVGGDIGMENYKMIFPFDSPNNFTIYGQENIGVIGRTLRAGSFAHSKLSFWRSVHAVQSRGMAEQIVAKSAKYIRDGGNDIALRDMGFTDDVVKSLQKDIKKMAKFDDSGNLIEFDLMQATDKAAAAEFATAVNRGAAQIIQGTYIGETGYWAHDSFLKFLTQFRTFSITSVEKQWGRQAANHGTMQAAGLLLAAMSFALPIHYARIQAMAMGREDKDEYIKARTTPGALVRATLNYTSLSGLFGDVLEIAGTVSGQGELMGGRPGTSNGAGSYIPALGWLDDAIKVPQKKTLHSLVKILPFSSLPYLHAIINSLED